VIRTSGEPCPRFGDEPASVVKRSLEHLGPSNLARRIGAVDNNSVHAAPTVDNNKVHAPIKRTQDKLEVARAALGKHAVVPEPLVDTTVSRKAVVANTPAVVANKKRSSDRHADPEARKAYQRELMRKKRAATKAAAP